MICFLLARNNSFTITNFRNFRGKEIAHRIKIVLYEEIEKLNGLELTAIIFSDLDRFTPEQLEKIRHIADLLEKAHPGLKILNHPNKVLRRYDLLRTLYHQGINSYNIFRITEPLNGIRFPVFLREENFHTGALTGLIYSHSDLKRHILAKKLLGYSKGELLVVEYCEIADDKGMHNKYSALRIDDSVIPRYYELSKNFVVKSDDSLSDYPLEKRLAHYWSYLTENPHEQWIRAVFETAGIEYGRIDYGLKGNGMEGKKEVWEINLNPAYYGYKKPVSEQIDKIYHFSHTEMKKAFISLDHATPVKINIQMAEKPGLFLRPHPVREIIRRIHDNFNTKRRVFQAVVRFMEKTAYFIAGIDRNKNRF